MARTLTSANGVFTLRVVGLFDVPQLLQGFGPDDSWDPENFSTAETKRGVDGRLSAGYVFGERKIGVTLQADSPSVDFFEGWFAAEEAVREKYVAHGELFLPSTQKIYQLTTGFLVDYSPFPKGGKILSEQKFGLIWEMITPIATGGVF